jgi:hypothetical protein
MTPASTPPIRGVVNRAYYERAFLGAMLRDFDAAKKAAEDVGLELGDFETLGPVYAAALTVRTNGGVVELPGVLAQLEADGQLEAVGGRARVSALADELPDVGSVRYYATELRMAALRPRLAVAASREHTEHYPNAAADVERPASELRRLEEGAEGEGVAFRRSVDAEAHRLRVRAEAERIVRLECAGALGALPEPALVPLQDFLAVEDDPRRYRIQDLWPVAGRVILAAPYKAGKTTLRDNLIRSLADGEPFLNRFMVHPPEGSIVLIDNELSERMLRDWLRKQGIVHLERISVMSLRGRLSTFDILDPEIRARWAGRLRAVGASVVVFDCLRAVLDALGLDEAREAGRFLVAFDALLTEADVAEGLIVHHAGHGSERSRGDSRLRDWPDCEWRLVREKAEDETEPQPDARRFLSAYGRDVDVPEGLLEYDKPTRRLRFAGGTRKESAADKLIPELLDYLSGDPGATGRQIENALAPPHRRGEVRQAVQRAVELGQVKTRRGQRRAILHTVAECAVRQNAARAPQNAGALQKSVRQSAPIGGAGRTTDAHPEASNAPTTHTGGLEGKASPVVPILATGTTRPEREPGDDDDKVLTPEAEL